MTSRKTKLGQHFLVNRLAAKRIIDAFLPVTGPVLEIGPGKGVLTTLLVKEMPEGDFAAIEKDPALFQELKKKFPVRPTLIQADVLSIDPAILFPGQPLNLISNVPYYLSKQLFDWLIRHQRVLKKAVFLVQREFADKLLVVRRRTVLSPQGILLNHLFQMTEIFKIQPGSFSPPPQVVSTLITLEKEPHIPAPHIIGFYAFLKNGFAHRRKTLFNNLKSRFSEEMLHSAFVSARIPLTARAEKLDWKVFYPLFTSLAT